ncbi:MAG: dephospho-CoA kinase [Chloroflexota bacterium]|nr:dephospho-CoA kinase [Chloroflexota bacterium]
MAGSNDKYIIGLTGNIAVGKSVVRRMLQHLGAYTIDADGLTHQAMSPGAPAYKPIIETFGRFVVDSNGQINRARLGAVAFAVPEAMQALEGIIHPIVGSAIQALVSRAQQRVVVVEAIKLLEGNLASMCNSIWVVDAPPDLQLKRLMESRKMGESEARQRIAGQNAQADKLKRAQVVINNAGDVDSTWKQVQDAWNAIFAAPKSAPSAPTVPAAPAAARTPAAPAPAAPPVPPAAPARITDEQPMVVGSIHARRGTPNNAAQIAEFMSKHAGKDVSRMDIMLAFGQKSYLLAQDAANNLIGVAGWQVENLITNIDEVVIAPDAPYVDVIHALSESIAEYASQLQSEVSFIFLPNNGDPSIREGWVKSGYQTIKIEDFASPAWREAAHEQMHPGVTGLYKQLRADRVTKPI